MDPWDQRQWLMFPVLSRLKAVRGTGEMKRPVSASLCEGKTNGYETQDGKTSSKRNKWMCKVSPGWKLPQLCLWTSECRRLVTEVIERLRRVLRWFNSEGEEQSVREIPKHLTEITHIVLNIVTTFRHHYEKMIWPKSVCDDRNDFVPLLCSCK